MTTLVIGHTPIALSSESSTDITKSKVSSDCSRGRKSELVGGERNGGWEERRLGGWEVGRLGGWEVGRWGGWEVGRWGGWEVGNQGVESWVGLGL